MKYNTSTRSSTIMSLPKNLNVCRQMLQYTDGVSSTFVSRNGVELCFDSEELSVEQHADLIFSKYNEDISAVYVKIDTKSVRDGIKLSHHILSSKVENKEALLLDTLLAFEPELLAKNYLHLYTDFLGMYYIYSDMDHTRSNPIWSYNVVTDIFREHCSQIPLFSSKVKAKGKRTLYSEKYSESNDVLLNLGSAIASHHMFIVNDGPIITMQDACDGFLFEAVWQDAGGDQGVKIDEGEVDLIEIDESIGEYIIHTSNSAVTTLKFVDVVLLTPIK